MAKWQREQLDSLLEYLPLDHAVAILDYSEGYTCRSQDETQSEYFDVAKVSLHVTILYCHSTEKNDGTESTEENPKVVKEHVFVISDDVIQDNNSVHKVQELLNTYITKDLGQEITVLHEMVVWSSINPATALEICLVVWQILVTKSSLISLKPRMPKANRMQLGLTLSRK